MFIYNFNIYLRVGNNNDANYASRRTVLKQLSAVGTALTVGACGTAAAEPDENQYEGFELPFPNVSVTKFHHSVKSATNHPEMLTLSRDAIDRHFQASDLDGQSYQEARNYVRQLRKDYPVERIEEGNRTIIKLAPEAGSPENVHRVDGKQNAKWRSREAHANAVSVFAGEGAGPPTNGNGNGDVSAQWAVMNHRTLTDMLLEDTTGYDYTIREAADDPDSFGADAKGRVQGISDQLVASSLSEYVTKLAVTEVVKAALDVYHSNYSQYYDPNIYGIDFGPLGTLDIADGLGRAPEAGKAFFEEAINESSSYDAEKKFGWSLHYLQDCSQPLHTGMGLEQAGLDVIQKISSSEIEYDLGPKRWLHYGFEYMVNDHWESTPSFSNQQLSDHLSGSQAPRIYNAGQAIRDMAGVSNDYSDTVYYEIFNNESKASDTYRDWSSSTKQTVYETVANCFSTLGYLGRGFCEEFERDRN